MSTVYGWFWVLRGCSAGNTWYFLVKLHIGQVLISMLPVPCCFWSRKLIGSVRWCVSATIFGSTTGECFAVKDFVDTRHILRWISPDPVYCMGSCGHVFHAAWLPAPFTPQRHIPPQLYRNRLPSEWMPPLDQHQRNAFFHLVQ